MTLRGFILALCVLVVTSCGDDQEGSSSATGGAGNATGGAGGASGSGSLCQQGCVATLAANCSNGPATQAQCEQDCQALSNGACSTEYRALQNCAIGKAVTCGATGLPTVQGCSTEQATFVSCLN